MGRRKRPGPVAQALEHECPSCGAAVGDVCRANHGGKASVPHTPRLRAAGLVKEPRRRPYQVRRIRPAGVLPARLSKSVAGVTWEAGSTLPRIYWHAHGPYDRDYGCPWHAFIDDATGQIWAAAKPVKLRAKYPTYRVREELPDLRFDDLHQAMSHFPLFLQRARFLGALLARGDSRLHQLEARFGHLIG